MNLRNLRQRILLLESMRRAVSSRLPIVGSPLPGESDADALARLRLQFPGQRVLLIDQFVHECV